MPRGAEKSSREKVNHHVVELVREIVSRSPGILDEDVEAILLDQRYKLGEIYTALDFLRGNLQSSRRRSKTTPELVVQTDKSAPLRRPVGRRFYLSRDIPSGTELITVEHNAALVEGADELIRNTLDPRQRLKVLASGKPLSFPLGKIDFEFLDQALKLISKRRQSKNKKINF